MARYLIVDDSPTSRRLLANLLRHADTDGPRALDIVETEDGAGAVAQLADGAFDAVFVDMLLGEDRSGLEALEAIVAREPGARVVLATALAADHPDVVAAVSRGAFGHLHKPVTIAAVREVLRRVAIDKEGDRVGAGRIPRWATGASRGRA